MKNRIKACVISFCILLCGCGASDTGAYLLATQETESQIPTESEVLVPDMEVVSEGKEAPLLVYVCGEVMTPGVYELADGCDGKAAEMGLHQQGLRLVVRNASDSQISFQFFHIPLKFCTER